MRIVGIAQLLAVLLYGAAYAVPGIGEDAPELTGVDYSSGKNIALAGYAGGWVFVDFWATWCGPCMDELPNLLEQTKALRDDGKLSLFSVSLDVSASTAEEYGFNNEGTSERLTDVLSEYGIDYPVIYDGNFWSTAAAQSWDIHSIPATFLVDPRGRIAATDLRGETLGSSLDYYLQLPEDHEYINAEMTLDKDADSNFLLNAKINNPAMQDLEVAVEYLFVKNIYAEDDTEQTGRPVDFKVFETNPEAPEHTETMQFNNANGVFEYSIEKMDGVDMLYVEFSYELPGSADITGEPLVVTMSERLELGS